MTFKFPKTYPVVQTASKVTVYPQPLAAPSTSNVLSILSRLENQLFGISADPMRTLLERWRELPKYISDKAILGVSQHVVKLYVFDFVSSAAKLFNMLEIRDYPDRYFDVAFPNWESVLYSAALHGPLQIELRPLNEEGARLLTELEQLETTCELTDWHR